MVCTWIYVQLVEGQADDWKCPSDALRNPGEVLAAKQPGRVKARLWGRNVISGSHLASTRNKEVLLVCLWIYVHFAGPVSEHTAASVARKPRVERCVDRRRFLQTSRRAAVPGTALAGHERCPPPAVMPLWRCGLHVQAMTKSAQASWSGTVNISRKIWSAVWTAVGHCCP